eukprot:12183453-Alexandrium_andersonii.AAC.1
MLGSSAERAACCSNAPTVSEASFSETVPGWPPARRRRAHGPSEAWALRASLPSACSFWCSGQC